ncbi:hypothetical protein MMC26_001879 [Xylographa opegraphella]|nr:hypothetical protein [Xylographa opegraphella]
MPNNDRREPTEEEPLLPSSAPPESTKGLSEDESNTSNQSVTRVRACCIISSLGVLIFLQACNISLLTTTQSTIAADLDAFAEVSWFTSAYLIAMASMSPLAGRLSQIFSPRWCIFVSTLLFAIGAFVTSSAARLRIFLLGRAITGVGAAGILTLSIILVIELTSKQRRGLFIGLVNTGYTTGVSLGAVIAGALVGPLGWRALFWMQSPLAVAAGLCIFFSMPRTFTTSSPTLDRQSLWQKLARVDYLGAILLTSSLTLLLTSLSSPHLSILPILLSFAILILFVLTEIYLTSTPIIPVNLLRHRGALLACLAQLGLMMARWSILFYTPVYALAVRTWSPATAGSILIPTNAGFAIGGLLAGLLHIRRAGSFYLACLVVFAINPFTLLLLGYLSTPDTPVALYLLSTFTNGLATGAALNYTLAHVLHLTPPSTHFIATSVLSTFRGFAGSFGSAIGGGIFTRILRASLEQGFAEKGLQDKGELVRRLLGSPALVAGLSGGEREVAISAYVDAIRGLFWAGAGLAVVVIAVQAGTGWKAGVEEKVEEEETATHHD